MSRYMYIVDPPSKTSLDTRISLKLSHFMIKILVYDKYPVSNVNRRQLLTIDVDACSEQFYLRILHTL